MAAARKPPRSVVSIKGSVGPDRVTQAELQAAADLQGAVWLAEKAARECVQAIESRLTCGATLEPGPLTFDRMLQMARRRGEEEGAG
jgi:hypothetical protein